MTNRLGITWHDVFNGNNLSLKYDIFDANQFLLDHTYYMYFSWNNKVYKVKSKFSVDTCDTGLTIKDLEN